jgi:hypothetical protein
MSASDARSPAPPMPSLSLSFSEPLSAQENKESDCAEQIPKEVQQRQNSHTDSVIGTAIESRACPPHLDAVAGADAPVCIDAAALPLSLSPRLSPAPPASDEKQDAPASAALGASSDDASACALASDLKNQQPPCPAPLATLLQSPELPWYAREAMEHCRGSSLRVTDTTAQQRFALAAVFAARAHHGGHMLFFPPEQLAAPLSESSIEPGHALPNAQVRTLCGELKCPTSLTGVEHKAAIDRAMRTLLRAMQTTPNGPTVARRLGAYADHLLGLPEGTTADVKSQVPVTSADLASAPQVRVLEMSGAGGQCFFRAVGTALGLAAQPQKLRPDLLHWPGIAQRICSSLNKIQSAPLLLHYGFPVAANATAEEVQAAKRHYFKSTQFREQCWGGSLEMNLLSHSYRGLLGFVVANTRAGPDRCLTVICAARAGSVEPPLQGSRPYCPAAGDVRPNREITLLHCAYSGLPERPLNHWELIQYDDAATGGFHCWNLQKEAPASLEARRAAIMAACHEAVERAARLSAERKAIIDAANSAPAEPAIAPAGESGGRSSPAALENALHTADHGGAAATADSALPCHATRLNTWRVLPKRDRRLLVTVMAPLMGRYASASAADNEAERDRLMHLFLDTPACALRKGQRKELRQSLRRHMALYNTLLDGSNVVPSPPADVLVTEPVVTSAIDEQKVQQKSPEIHSPQLQSSDIVLTDKNEGDEEDETIRCIRRAAAIVHEGGARALSRASKSLMQLPPVAVTSETVRQLVALHPQPAGSLSALPADRAAPLVAVDAAALFRILKRRVDNGSAPGPSGWTGSLLMVLASSDSKEVQAGLCAMVKDINNAVFTGAAQRRLLASVLIPLSKPTAGVRPIAVGEVLTKLAAHYSMSLIEDQLPKLFPSIQYGVKRPGGSESAAQLIRAALDESSRLDPRSVAIQLDFTNAFNACSRAQAWEKLLRTPETECM